MKLALVRHNGNLLDGAKVDDMLLTLGVDTSSSEEGGSLLRLLLLLMVDVDLHLSTFLCCSV